MTALHRTRRTAPLLAGAAALLACAAPRAATGQSPSAHQAAPAPQAAPRLPDPRVQALLAWIDPYFPWGEGEIALDEITQLKVPGYRILKATKKYKLDERANDQTYLALEDNGKSALIGDVFLDEDRFKARQPVRTEADLDGVQRQLSKFFRGRFRVALDPSLDRPSWKGIRLTIETGYGTYDASGFVTASDGAFALVGRAWDRNRGFPEQRRALINLADTPAIGPEDAKVTVVEYSDMECPYCKKRTKDWDVLAAKLAPVLKIRRYFKAFPLTNDHPWAFRASSAGRCFYEKSPALFLNWKSSVYARQEQLNVAALDTFALDFAVANGIPQLQFQSCYLQGRSVERVHEDMAEGFAVRVRSTPTYFVDGQPVSWFADDLMEEYLRKTYLKGAGLPLPHAAKPAAASRK